MRLEPEEKRNSRIVASRAAQETVAGARSIAIPISIRVPLRRKDLQLTIGERIVVRFLTRRRRLEFLEPLLSWNFRSPEIFLKMRTDVRDQLFRKLQELEESGPMFFGGKTGALELREIFEDLRDIAAVVAQRRSPAEWLLMIRRAFIAPFDGDALAPQWFIESFLRRSTREGNASGLCGRRLKNSPRDLRDLHDLVLITTAMWQVSKAFRTVTKGLVVTIAATPLLVGVAFDTNPEVRAALELFEKRRRTQGHRKSTQIPGHRSGPMRLRFAPDPKSSEFKGAMAGFFEFGSEFDRGRYFLRWRTHYRPMFLDGSELVQPKTSQRPSPRSLAAAVILKTCWDEIGLSKRFRMRTPLGPWNLWGVHALRHDQVDAILTQSESRFQQFNPDWTKELGRQALLGPADESEWIDSNLPFGLRLDDTQVLIDLLAATNALEDAYHRPAGGAVPKEWTDLFEDQVQEAVDGSFLRPAAEVRPIRHRTFRRLDGSPITEIDVIAATSEYLLAVGVKAWTQPDMLEFGEYTSLQDRMDEVEHALADWKIKVAELAQTAAFTNLIGDRTVIAMVVCPEVQYVMPGPTTEEVLPGLLAVSSFLEFQSFLDS